jgi:phosphoribosylglycinamide formyltransferase-1
VSTLTGDAVNLIAHLGDPRFDPVDVHHAIEALDRNGITITREHHAPDALLAWIDEAFGGVMSFEASRGGVLYARDAQGYVGFAAYDARTFDYRWVAPYAKQSDLGIFGPIAVLDRVRGSGLAPLLLRGAMYGLRERGYRRAFTSTSSVGNEAFARWFEREAGGRVVDRFVRQPKDRRYRTTILASGNGSNFAAVAEAAAAGTLPLEVTTLIANRASARAVERAKEAGVASRVVLWDRTSESRGEFDARLLLEVAETEPDVVLLLGWMHILPEIFVTTFRCLNVHPAFLPYDPTAEIVTVPDGTTIPAFRGAHAVDDALAAGVGWIGASFHRVGVEVDRGSLLARLPLKLEPGESRADLDARLHALERKVVATGIQRWSWEQK